MKTDLRKVSTLYYIDGHQVRKRRILEIFGEWELGYGEMLMYKSINRTGTLYSVELCSDKLGIKRYEPILVTHDGIYGKHIRYYADLDDMMQDANKRLQRYTHDANKYHGMAAKLDSRVYFTNKLLKNIENTK